MIPEIGHIFLVTSLVLSLVGGLSAFIFKRELPILKISSILGLLIIGSFFALVYSFVTVSYTHLTLPTIYSV